MKNKKIFKLNFIYFSALILVAVIFVLGNFGIIENEWLSSFLIQIVVMAAIPLLMYKLLFKKSLKTTLKDVGFKKISSKSIFIIIVLGFALYFLNSYIATFFSSIISLLGYERLILAPSTTTFSYGLFLQEFLLTAILPGICEEILHRGIMLNCAKKLYNARYCLLISSILFGITHLNINQFFYAAILGYFMGYLNLACDSIYPSIIVHFMNNFLSTYFTFGKALNWPFANFVYNIEAIITSNIFLFISFSTLAVISILALYLYLTKLLLKEKAKKEIYTVVNSLKLNQLSLIEAQIKINEANKILKHKSAVLSKQKFQKPSLLDNLFLIAAFVLGISVTIFSFIWGIL